MPKTIRGIFAAYAPVYSEQPIRLNFDLRIRASLEPTSIDRSAPNALPGPVFLAVAPEATTSDVINALEEILRDIKRNGLFIGLSPTGEAMHDSRFRESNERANATKR